MSKVKLKFIITTVFCSIFISTISVFSMKETKKDEHINQSETKKENCSINLRDLSNLNLDDINQDKTKETKVCVISSQNDENDENDEKDENDENKEQTNKKYYNINNEMELLDLYAEQLDAYQQHFTIIDSVLSNVKYFEEKCINLDTSYEDNIKNIGLKNDYIASQYVYYEGCYDYYESQQEPACYYFTIKDLNENFKKIDKIIEDLNNIFNKIKQSKDNNNIDIALKGKIENLNKDILNIKKLKKRIDDKIITENVSEDVENKENEQEDSSGNKDLDKAFCDIALDDSNSDDLNKEQNMNSNMILGDIDSENEKESKKYRDLNDLSEIDLDIDLNKDSYIRVLPRGLFRTNYTLKNSYPYYSIKDRNSIMKLYHDQIYNYKEHFFNVKIALDKLSLNSTSKTAMTYNSVDMNEIGNSNAKIYSKYNKEHNLYNISSFIEDWYNLNKIIVDMKKIIEHHKDYFKSIQNDEEYKELKEKTDNYIENISNVFFSKDMKNIMFKRYISLYDYYNEILIKAYIVIKKYKEKISSEISNNNINNLNGKKLAYYQKKLNEIKEDTKKYISFIKNDMENSVKDIYLRFKPLIEKVIYEIDGNILTGNEIDVILNNKINKISHDEKINFICNFKEKINNIIKNEKISTSSLYELNLLNEIKKKNKFQPYAEKLLQNYLKTRKQKIVNELELNKILELNYSNVDDLSEINSDDDVIFSVLPGKNRLTNKLQYYDNNKKEKLLPLYLVQLSTYDTHLYDSKCALCTKNKNDDFAYDIYITNKNHHVDLIGSFNSKIYSKYECKNNVFYYKIEYLLEDLLNINKILKDVENILKSIDKTKCDEKTTKNIGDIEYKKNNIKKYIHEIEDQISTCRLKYMIDEYSETINLARHFIEFYRKRLEKELENIDKNQEIDKMVLSDIENIIKTKTKLKRYIEILSEKKIEEAQKKGYEFIHTQFTNLFNQAYKEIEDESYLKNNIIEQKVKDIKNEIKELVYSKEEKSFIKDFKEDLKKVKEVIYGKEEDIKQKIDFSFSTKSEEEKNEYIKNDIFDIKSKHLDNITSELNENINLYQNQLNQDQDIDNLNSKNYGQIEIDDLSELNLKKENCGNVRVLSMNDNQTENRYYDISNIQDLFDLYIEQLKVYEQHFKTLFKATIEKNEHQGVKRNRSDGKYYLIVDEFKDFINVDENIVLDKILRKNASICNKYLKEKGLYESEAAIEDCCNAEKIIKNIENCDMENYTTNGPLEEKIEEIRSLKTEIKEMLKDILEKNIVIWEVVPKSKLKYSKILNDIHNDIKIYLFFLKIIFENNEHYYKNEDYNKNSVIAQLEEYKDFKDYTELPEIKNYLSNKLEDSDVLKSEVEFNTFKGSSLYSKYFTKLNKDGKYDDCYVYYYTLDELINDIANIKIVSEKINKYMEKFEKYKKIEAQIKKSDIIYKRYRYRMGRINYRNNSEICGLKSIIDELIEKFNIKKEVDAIKERLKELEKNKNENKTQSENINNKYKSDDQKDIFDRLNKFIGVIEKNENNNQNQMNEQNNQDNQAENNNQNQINEQNNQNNQAENNNQNQMNEQNNQDNQAENNIQNQMNEQNNQDNQAENNNQNQMNEQNNQDNQAENNIEDQIEEQNDHDGENLYGDDDTIDFYGKYFNTVT